MKWPNQLIPNRYQFAVITSLSALAGSCATTAGYKDIKLPAYAGAYFSECSGKDGSLSIEMYENGKVSQVFDADWSADSNSDYSLASYSPLGQTLFQLDYSAKQKSFKQTGKPLGALETLKVGSNSMLELEGHQIGLRADEVTCLLNHKLPQRWLKKIVAEDSTPKHTRFIIKDSDRTIRISLPKSGGKSEESWQAKIDWSLYWGLKRLSLDMKLLRNEQALVMQASPFEKIDVRVIAQEE